MPEGTRLGRAGAPVYGIEAGVVAIDLPSIAAGASGVGTGTIVGVRAGDIVQVQPPDTINAGLVFQGAAVTAVDTVTVRVRNESAAAIDEPSRNYPYIWVDTTAEGG